MPRGWLACCEAGGTLLVHLRRRWRQAPLALASPCWNTIDTMELADEVADSLALAKRCVTAWESPVTPPQAGKGRLWRFVGGALGKNECGVFLCF